MATPLRSSLYEITEGESFIGPSQITGSLPLAWVSPGTDPVRTFTHEVGHLFGCKHNRDEHEGRLSIGTNYWTQLLTGLTSLATYQASSLYSLIV